MKRISAFLVLMFPLVALAQETADKGTLYGLAYGLVIFLAAIGAYTVFEKIRDRLESKNNRAEEEARKLRIENDEREAKL